MKPINEARIRAEIDRIRAERDAHEQARRALEEEVGQLRYENAALREVLAAAVECWDGPKYKHFMGPVIDMARALLAKYDDTGDGR